MTPSSARNAPAMGPREGVGGRSLGGGGQPSSEAFLACGQPSPPISLNDSNGSCRQLRRPPTIPPCHPHCFPGQHGVAEREKRSVAGLKSQPPGILLAEEPTVLVAIDGEHLLRREENGAKPPSRLTDSFEYFEHAGTWESGASGRRRKRRPPARRGLSFHSSSRKTSERCREKWSSRSNARPRAWEVAAVTTLERPGTRGCP
jgi:hypothetical protein